MTRKDIDKVPDSFSFYLLGPYEVGIRFGTTFEICGEWIEMECMYFCRHEVIEMLLETQPPSDENIAYWGAIYETRY